MATHIALRLAWHNDGWNGRICTEPGENSYCVGCHSYPGELIREKRDLEWEKENSGRLINELERRPPCVFSACAFSDHPCVFEADPPDFFKDNSETATWSVPPATACVWPYEPMYSKETVLPNGGYDYAKRLSLANEFFSSMEPNVSLVFYYTNYSNPFSEDDSPKYVLVGVARIKEVGPQVFYEGCSERTIERYKGFVWQRHIHSHYPDQGLRLPYHKYRNQPDILEQFAVFPENSQSCKYATRHVDDDVALGLLEQLLSSVRILRDDIQDTTEDWGKRLIWLESLIAELWNSRGAYPGMPAVLEYLGLEEAIDSFRQYVLAGKEQQAVEEIQDFCAGAGEGIGEYLPFAEERKKVLRNLKLNVGGDLELLLGVLSRFSLTTSQLVKIFSDRRSENGIIASLKDLQVNPYLLSEQYQGDDPDDRVYWSMIDRGVIPSPDLGVKALFDNNAPERVRALLLEQLRFNAQQTFVKSGVLLNQINRRLIVLPEWKRIAIHERYLEVDQEYLEKALYLRKEQNHWFLYDRRIWSDERQVEKVLGDLLIASDISLKKPVTEAFWQQVLFSDESSLAAKVREDYQLAINGQKAACGRIFPKRLSVLTGGAGTGKSTVIRAIIKAIKKAHGESSKVAVLAPTGKATDRLRQVLYQEEGMSSIYTATIHSLLASNGWLNPNMSFRQEGGTAVDCYSAIIIDECSMIDLTLMAALFRSIDWHSVQRLILVGDPAQLPPIGTGKVFADLVAYLGQNFEENLAELKDNLRQLENIALGKGNGILGVAGCYLNSISAGGEASQEEEEQREQLIQSLHEGGEIDKDLQIEYWSDSESLADLIIDRVTADLTDDDNHKESPAKIWSDALFKNINSFQILSPVRGENYGTETINRACQLHKSSYWLSKGNIDGITLFDKVIQIFNRPPSNPLHGYDFNKNQASPIEVYNGELGVVRQHPFDGKVFKNYKFHVNRFSVKFAGKDHQLVHYGHNLGKDKNGRFLKPVKPAENIELGYAISVHKSQGSEFERVYVVLPSLNVTRQQMELIYTALTRATAHCTIFVQDDVSTLLNAMRREQSALTMINSSLFEFRPVNDALLEKSDWYEAGKIHEALTGDMVRSKSEVIIANLLHERKMPFRYEEPLIAPDGTMYLPDFTITCRGEDYYWEHLGRLGESDYSEHWKQKAAWYEKYFSGKLLITKEGKSLSKDAADIIDSLS